MRSATQPYCNTVEYGCISLRMRFFPQNFGTIKRILPGSSSPSHRKGPGIEVEIEFVIQKSGKRGMANSKTLCIHFPEQNIFARTALFACMHKLIHG